MDKVVYHGSTKGNIEILRANVSTHQKECIYATDNKVIAMLFMGRGMRDLDTVKGYDDGLPVLVERRQGVLERLYNKSGYIYELDGTTFNHYDYLWEPEVISFEKAIIPIKKIYYDNVLEALNNESEVGNIKIYKYPSRPNYIPLDNSDLIDEYIEFEQEGINGAIELLLKVYPEFETVVMEKLDNKKRNIQSCK